MSSNPINKISDEFLKVDLWLFRIILFSLIKLVEINKIFQKRKYEENDLEISGKSLICTKYRSEICIKPTSILYQNNYEILN